MELRLSEFSSFDDPSVKNIEELPAKYWEPALELLKECIIINDFVWDGAYHQNGDYGLPIIEVVSDGVLRRYYMLFSMRAWGTMMAEARNMKEQTSRYDYMDFYCTMPLDEVRHPSGRAEFIEPMTRERLLDAIATLGMMVERILPYVDWDKRLEDDVAENLSKMIRGNGNDEKTDEELERARCAERIERDKKSYLQSIRRYHEMVIKQCRDKGGYA